MKYGVRYPKSGVHECPFGLEQARLVQLLAIRHDIDAQLVASENGLQWEVLIDGV